MNNMRRDDRFPKSQKAAKLLKHKFAVVRMWPDQSVSEHSNISYLSAAAKKLGLEMIEIDRFGVILSLRRAIRPNEVDFVIHLHYETAKTYDAYSYGVLWDPIRHYFNWGYERFSETQLSHDGFISTGAIPLEDFVIRGRPGEFRRGCFPIMHMSLYEPLFAPEKRNDRVAMYVGINWERIDGRPGRHSKVFKQLDATGLIAIFGPHVLQNGIVPWEGFRSYRRPLEFDGHSVVEKASECGIMLALSAEEHKRSKVMPNRLFEGLAAGALIIADSHSFIRDNFGNSCLYIDDNKSSDDQAQQIVDLITWANSHPDAAYEKCVESQRIFREKFRLDGQLLNLYEHYLTTVNSRVKLVETYNKKIVISFCYIALPYRKNALERFLEGLQSQSMNNFEFVVACCNETIQEIREICHFYLPGKFSIIILADPRISVLSDFGHMAAILAGSAKGRYVAFSLGVEQIFSSYVESICSCIIRSNRPALIQSGYLLTHPDERSGNVFCDYFYPTKAVHPAALPAMAVCIDSYRKHQPLFDHLGLVRWTHSAQAMLSPRAISVVPQVKGYLSEQDAIARQQRTVASSLSDAEQQEIVRHYVAATRINPAAQPKSAIALNAISLTQAASVEERASILQVLMSSLPVPRWLICALQVSAKCMVRIRRFLHCSIVF